jgi:hydroxypyruvate reductase
MLKSAFSLDFFQDLSLSEKIHRILHISLDSVNPTSVVNNFVKTDGNDLVINGSCFKLKNINSIIVIGFGKASQKMALGLKMALKEIQMRGVIICKHDQSDITNHLLPEITTLIGDHPIPGDTSLNATKAIIKLITHRRSNELVICLISGGGSSLFTNPSENLSLSSLQELTGLLIKSGAPIQEINTVRKHLDAVKGGGLVKLIYPNQLLALIISDVIGDTLSMIASGPTAEDPTTFNDALRVIQKYGLEKKVDKVIVDTLKDGLLGKIEESLKPGDYRMKRVHNFIIGNNRIATLAGRDQAIKEGFYCEVISNHLSGEAREVGRYLGRILIKVKNEFKYPLCLIAGGESTVTVKGKGKGGRNQEVALAAALEIAGMEKTCFLTLATDGEDGNTDAAGAVVTGSTVKIAHSMGINPKSFLEQNNCYEFFRRVGGMIKTGPTGTNVNDLYFLFVY